jgi:hypothetical protein
MLDSEPRPSWLLSEPLQSSSDSAGALRERLRVLARRRFGYRRLLIFLRREGFVVNHKRIFCIYRGERLMVRKRGRPQKSLGTRAPMAVPRISVLDISLIRETLGWQPLLSFFEGVAKTLEELSREL